jgi:hypothetical protein
MIKLKVRPWLVPDYASAEAPPRSREEGFDPCRLRFPIKELDAETLAELCDKFREEVFKKAGKEDPTKSKAKEIKKDDRETN